MGRVNVIFERKEIRYVNYIFNIVFFLEIIVKLRYRGVDFGEREYWVKEIEIGVWGC